MWLICNKKCKKTSGKDSQHSREFVGRVVFDGVVKEERARVGVGRAKTYDAAPAGSHCTGGTLTLPAHAADGTEGDRGAGGKQVCLTARRRLPPLFSSTMPRLPKVSPSSVLQIFARRCPINFPRRSRKFGELLQPSHFRFEY